MQCTGCICIYYNISDYLLVGLISETETFAAKIIISLLEKNFDNNMFLNIISMYLRHG